jgi:hypothetical protein
MSDDDGNVLCWCPAYCVMHCSLELLNNPPAPEDRGKHYGWDLARRREEDIARDALRRRPGQ